MNTNIYIADDEKHIRDLISAFLTQEGFEVTAFDSGDKLLSQCITNIPDLVILDIMMPGTDGLSICSQLRNLYPELPIIIVSAKDNPYDRVTGLTLGSDDYLVKPFLPLELVARVKSLLRRSRKNREPQTVDMQEIRIGRLLLFPDRREAILENQKFPLTPTEFDFLMYMANNRGRAVSRDELLQTLWNVNWQADTRAADDLVKRLRRKLREANSLVHIDTVWGFGFRISTEENIQ